MSLSRLDTLKFFNNDELATDVYLKKYALTNRQGEIEEFLPTQMWRRMAKAAAAVEKDAQKWEEQFYEILKDWKSVPQGSIMFALGNPYQKSSCSNCFVVPIKSDDLESIFDCAKEMARTYSYRGGVGTDLTVLRPEKSIVSNSARTSTGAWSFMDFYSYVTRLIGQHGRRGALMLTIADNHPDLMKFITAKTDKTKVTGANISIKISDKFMEAVKNDEQWVMEFKTAHETIQEIKPAREIWDLIIETATNTAEPGILFWDNIIKESPSDCYSDVGFESSTTNPCSEIPLANYDACTLLSQNLTKYTRNDFTNKAYFDFYAFEKDVIIATRLLDNVKQIDLELMPLPQQREIAAKGRRIGMGTHGLADALANLTIKYDSQQAVEMIEKIYSFYAKTVYNASVELAQEKGPFSVFNAEKEKRNPFLNRIGFAGIPRRNISCLTCAPTGTVSTLSQTSSGIEPVFRNSYKRRRKLTHNEVSSSDKISSDKMGDYWQEYQVYHHNAKRYLDLNPNAELPEYFVESHQIDWEKRVLIQSTMTKYIDHSISSTVNLPAGTTKETVKTIYESAHRQGCKGFTVYVEGCRDGVLISEDNVKSIQKTNAPKRPKDLDCDVYHINVRGQAYFVIVGLYKGEPYEVFAGQNGVFDKKVKKAIVSKVKRGQYKAILDTGEKIENISDYISDEQAAITRLISLSLRHGSDIKHCVSVLEKVPGDMHNFARSLSRALKNYIPDGTKITGHSCVNCNSENIVRQEGCTSCLDCGNSKCG